MWRELGDFRGEQASLNHLGLVCWQQERFGEADSLLRQPVPDTPTALLRYT